jgi:hypothetical protein
MQAVTRLDAIDSEDPEVAHHMAEEILLDLAPFEVRNAYFRLVERAKWWASA